jgi:hypothetical protein
MGLKLNVTPPPATPASLSMTVSFSEPSGNQALDALEAAALVVAVTNNGPGEAHDVTLRVKAVDGGREVTLPAPLRLGDIGVGKKVEQKLAFSGSRNLEEGALRLEVSGLELNGFDADKVVVKLPTRKFEPARLEVADLGIDDQNQNGQVEPMEVVEVTARIRNSGFGPAEKTSARVALGENVYQAMESPTSFELGAIQPGGWQDIRFSFYTNKRIGAGEKIPLAIHLSEQRGGITAEVPLALTMNVPQRRANEVVIAGRQIERPQAAGPADSLAVDVEQNIPLGGKAGKFDVAVIVGNQNYRRSGVPPVKFAHRDLGVLKEYLVRTFGFAPHNIIEEKDATKGTFETLFGSSNNAAGKLAGYVKPGQSRVFIYYVGHGAPDINSGEGYFVPVDADPDYIANSGYPLSLFYANLKKIKARELVVVLDACFSGQTPDGLLFKNISPALLKVRDTAADLTAGAVFASAGNDQVSTWYEDKKHSLFTYFFLKGLQGEADSDKDRSITVGEMEGFLTDNVPYWANRVANKKQDPRVEGGRELVLVSLK